MDKEDIQQMLSRILDHTPEVKIRAGKQYAHGRTEPGALISVSALKDRTRVSFITEGRANDVSADEFLRWVNESGIMAIQVSGSIGYEIRKGVKNKNKIEIYADIPYEGRSEADIVAETVVAYNTLLEKLSGSFKIKTSDNAPSDDEHGDFDGEKYPTYHILIADTDSDSILANVVYAEVGQEIWGCYSGYAGGGAVDYRFFRFDADYEPTVEDDYFAFPIDDHQEVEAVFTHLESTRAKMESDDPEALVLSEAGQQFLDDGEVDDTSGFRSRLSEDASEDIVYDLQDEWTLLFRLQ